MRWKSSWETEIEREMGKIKNPGSKIIELKTSLEGLKKRVHIEDNWVSCMKENLR